MITIHSSPLSVALTPLGGIGGARCGGAELRLLGDEIRIDTDRGTFSTTDGQPAVRRSEDGLVVVFRWDTGRDPAVELEYRVSPDRDYIRRYIRLENRGRLSVYRIAARMELAERPRQVIDYSTFWNASTAAFVRFPDTGFYTGFENPFFRTTGDGRLVETSFEPSLILSPGEGYVSEANFLGLYRLTGRMIAQQTPPTGMRLNGVPHTRYRNPCGHVDLDRAEHEAFSQYARDYLAPRVDSFKLIFYQFFIPLPQQPCTDADEAVYRHYIDNFAKMGGDIVTFNPLVRHRPPAPTEDGYWDLAPPGSRAERIIDYARGRGLDIGFYMGSAGGNAAYCTSPMTPFALDDRPMWKKRSRDGALSSENCIASDSFADWFYRVQRNTIERFGVTLWDWDPGPGNGCFCWSADHGHIPGKGAYRGFRSAMGLIQRLRQDFPKLYIQGFHGTKEYGLWGQRGFDQHECYWEQDLYYRACIYPDFSEDRLTAGGMRFQSQWNQLFRFLPPEMNHALASRMTQNCMMPGSMRELDDERGWKYAFFSALAVGASVTVTMMPKDVEKFSGGEYLEYFRKWIPWCRENFRYARYNRPIGSQPACGVMDGYARIIGGHGYIFLFNPGPTEVEAKFTLDEDIGLNADGIFGLRWLYPMEDVELFDEISMRDAFHRGDTVRLRLEPYGCAVLELRRAEERQGPRLRNIPGRLTVRGREARIDGCTGREGRRAAGWIPDAGDIGSVTVNGREVHFEILDNAARFSLCFGAEPFDELISDWEDEHGRFPLMRHPATGPRLLRARLHVPASMGERLRAHTPEDEARRLEIIGDLRSRMGRESFGWARPNRLYLMLSFVYLDSVRGLRARLGGVPLKLCLLSTSHGGVRTGIMYYSDVTELVTPGGGDLLELELEGMAADSFLGARLDFPEGPVTEAVTPCDRIAPPVPEGPLGLPRQLRPAPPEGQRPVIESAWIEEGLIRENRPYTIYASVNLPPEQLEGVYVSAQVSIDGRSGESLRSDQSLIWDPAARLWRLELHPGSRRLLIIDGADLHLWAVTRDALVSDPYRLPAEWTLGGM